MDDLISREAALDCFNDWVDRHGDVHAADEDIVYQKIEALPSYYSEEQLQKMQELEQAEIEKAYGLGRESAQSSDSKIEKAIRVLQSKYNKALSQDYIRNPIAWALYQAWKEFDK